MVYSWTKESGVSKDAPGLLSTALITPKTGALVFGGMVVVGISVGAVIATHMFLGVVTLTGLIALIESSPKMKTIVAKHGLLVDVVIFGVTIAAALTIGVTAAGALSVAGLGFTLVYRPYLRQQLESIYKF